VSKTHKLDIRLDADQLREIERGARALNMPKSQYARLLLTGVAVQKSPTAPLDENALADIKEELAEIRAELNAAARAFKELLSFLKEQRRIPSFRQYRSRTIVEGITRRENETDLQYFLRLAEGYYLLYQRWPKFDPVTFGPVPQGFDARQWPSEPPR